MMLMFPMIREPRLETASQGFSATPKAILQLLCAVLLALPLQAAASETALDRYVRAPDPNFTYELVKTIPGEGYTAYVLDMTSQQYLTAAEVNHPIWRHWLTIVKPNTVTTNVGLLIISGGDNGDALPDKVESLASNIATTTGAVVAILSMVPNQPLIFAGESREREEDAIIAYTWDKFLRTGDEKWPLRLPMTKSAVRAMDAVSGFLVSGSGGGVRVEKYVSRTLGRNRGAGHQGFHRSDVIQVDPGVVLRTRNSRRMPEACRVLAPCRLGEGQLSPYDRAAAIRGPAAASDSPYVLEGR